MKIFISWSGERSKAIAEILREWLPNVVHAVRPWVSASDIEKGARWVSNLAVELDQTKIGIICLTPENLDAPWIMFEAGALSKTLQTTYVCPFLFGLEPSDIKGPLVQFQATKAEKEDTKKLIHTINRALGGEARPERKVEETFEVWWPKLEEGLRKIRKPQDNQRPERRKNDIVLEEILGLVREQARKDIPEYIPLPRSGASTFIIKDDSKFVPSRQAEFKVGDRVNHARYGDGKVIAIKYGEVSVKLDSGSTIKARVGRGVLKKYKPTDD
ncbi:MAG TPA: toll/interleukin-1 receptor domain-containing protein [Pyrinomonadaceae bacterium]